MIRYDAPANDAPPPGFLAAKNRRQKARAAGLHPDYWYPVARAERLAPGKVLGTRFWGRPIAVYRDAQGQAHALEDRCAHRQLKLSLGLVKGCNLVCQYHGWEYSSDGKVAAIPHDLYGKPFPNLQIGAFAVQERYGLVWIFPGDPALARTRPLPEIPELEGAGRWGSITVDAEWKTHHSMVLENASDFSRVYKSRPSGDARLTRCEAVGDRVYVGTSRIERCYEYPYQWSSTDDKIKSYCFVLPMDEHTTHSFFLYAWKSPRIPFSLRSISTRLGDRFLDVANKLLVSTLMSEDRRSCEAELVGYLRNYEAPIAEFNPAVGLFQQLTIRKWEEYLASRHVVSAGSQSRAAT
jgi:nitrite reductase/ring-hydroxylating ferredoxin subunit